MMGYWERLHPVNAVQIAELPQSIGSDELQAAISRLFGKFFAANDSCRWPKLPGDLEVSAREIVGRFRMLPETSEHPLEAFVTELLNQPFADDEPPFRVGLAQGRRGRYLWLSYRHAIADARSITLLMQNLLEELAWDGTGELPLLVERERRSLSDFFPAKRRGLSVLRSAISSAKTLWRVGRCHRERPADSNSYRMSFQIHAEQLPLQELQRHANHWQVTVGELMLASMLDWFLQKDHSQRPDASSPSRCVSVLVDLTSRVASKPTRQFGQFLSPVNITANRRHSSSFEELLHQVRATARPDNAVTDSLHSLSGLSLNSFLLRRMPRAMASRYQEFLLPVSGAFSNVNLNSVMPPWRSDVSMANYFRGTCATQLSPMILCLTTVRDTCTLTTTHRDAVYTAEEMQDLARSVMGRAFGIEANPRTQNDAGRHAV